MKEKLDLDFCICKNSGLKVLLHPAKIAADIEELFFDTWVNYNSFLSLLIFTQVNCKCQGGRQRGPGGPTSPLGGGRFFSSSWPVCVKSITVPLASNSTLQYSKQHIINLTQVLAWSVLISTRQYYIYRICYL